MTGQPPSRVRFGIFEIDLASGELWRNGAKIKVQEQPFQLLAVLLERPGEVVTREALRDRLWPADTFVDFDHSLNTSIKKLRQALGDSADNPRFIETLARRGYRFIAPVRPPSAPASIEPAATAGAATVPLAVPPPGVGDEMAAADRPPISAAVPSPPVESRRGWLVVAAIATVLVVGAAVWGGRRYASNRPAAAERVATRRAQIAVLPLKVLTPGETEKYLGIGLADAVITHLANVRTLSVRPTAAVIKYEAGVAEPWRAGEDLDAEHVLSGTLQKSDESYRISVQLIRTADRVPIWGHSYQVARTDLLTIEEQVSQQVADALRVQLQAGATGRQRVTARSPAAYEAYLQGRALSINYSDAKMRAAIESFERALQLEPDYALARAGLATSLAWFSVRFAYQQDAVDWGKRAEEQAYRALALDHDLAEAHLAIGNAPGTVYGHFNWPRRLAEADEALKLDPTLDLAHAARARGLYHLGLFEAGHAAASTAIALNPEGNVETHRLLVALDLFGGRFAEAAARAEDLAGQTDAPVIRMYLGQALFYLGKRREAADLLASIRRGDEPDVRSQAVLAAVLAADGQHETAERIAAVVQTSRSMDHHVAYSLGATFAQLGRPHDAVRWLQAAIDDGFPCYPWFVSDPLLTPLRDDARYQSLMAELRRRFEATRARYAPQTSRSGGR
jgi:DNA-binding winged helix-turn-helix (wHTH) protein/TolB-like protein